MAFHRSCWRTSGVALDPNGPCLTPDCWGRLARVESFIDRDGRQPDVRVEWSAGSTLVSGTVETAPDRRRTMVPTAKLPSDRRVDAWSETTICDAVDNDNTSVPVVSEVPVDDLPGREPVPPVLAGGVAYRKKPDVRERAPPKTHRVRTQKRQRARARSAVKTTALPETRAVVAPMPVVEDVGVVGDCDEWPAVESTMHADDALWPSFFVSDRDDIGRSAEVHHVAPLHDGLWIPKLHYVGHTTNASYAVGPRLASWTGGSMPRNIRLHVLPHGDVRPGSYCRDAIDFADRMPPTCPE